MLPEVLEVYDENTFRRNNDSIGAGRDAWDSVWKSLAGRPIKFVRKYPVRFPRSAES